MKVKELYAELAQIKGSLGEMEVRVRVDLDEDEWSGEQAADVNGELLQIADGSSIFSESGFLVIVADG